MFAIIEVGRKQYPVEKGDIIEIPYLSKKKSIAIKDVLLTAKGKKIDIGQPHLKGATVTCEVMGDKLAPKIYAFKFKRRKGYKKKIGHRQKYTLLKIKDIKV